MLLIHPFILQDFANNSFTDRKRSLQLNYNALHVKSKKAKCEIFSKSI